METVELSAREVRTAAAEPGRLLLDAHASNMALGLAGPLTAGRTRLGVPPAHSARPDGTLAGGTFYFLEL